MQVTLEMYEEKLFCTVFTKIWIAGHFLSKSYVGFQKVAVQQLVVILTDLQMWPSNKALFLLCEPLPMGSLITVWHNILLGPVIHFCVQPDCFVWISEQTAIISLFNINWLVFITEI